MALFLPVLMVRVSGCRELIYQFPFLIFCIWVSDARVSSGHTICCCCSAGHSLRSAEGKPPFIPSTPHPHTPTLTLHPLRHSSTHSPLTRTHPPKHHEETRLTQNDITITINTSLNGQFFTRFGSTRSITFTTKF
jgi:hypothetical protein